MLKELMIYIRWWNALIRDYVIELQEHVVVFQTMKELLARELYVPMIVVALVFAILRDN